MKLGFGCVWGPMPEETWSGTPWGLLGALGRRTQVVDLGPHQSATQTVLRYAYVRRRRGRWKSMYRWSPAWDRKVHKSLQSSLSQTPVDTVIEVGDLARLDVPYYVYQDLSFEVLARYYESAIGVPGFEGIDLETIKRRRERQHGIYESAAGLFAMSEWFANTLVEWSGLPRHKVTVAYAGLNAVEAGVRIAPDPDPGDEGPAKLLFVGRDFFRKGGETVVKALAHLRREYSPDVGLTVVGPDGWPLAGDVPEGIAFLGNRTPAEVSGLYRQHDLFVMPSRFEAYGIVFREALANGLPIVARSAFAMPEIVEPGRNGALVSGDDPVELADAVVGVLENPDIRRFTARTAQDVRERFSWDAVARRMLDAVTAPPG